MKVDNVSKNIEAHLNVLYERYNRREFIHPDPLEFLFYYEDIRDREIVGLIASSLAYGRVVQILKSVSIVLEKMAPSPFEFITSNSEKDFLHTFKSFKHRFTTGEELTALCLGIKAAIRKHGSLEACFSSRFDRGNGAVCSALAGFCTELHSDSQDGYNSLIPKPEKGSACKRLHLYLRWMTRRDGVDPGGWDSISASDLIVPLDIHMHRIGLALGLTGRKQSDIRTAKEVTDGFRAFSPEDPVKFDFSLTRLGIRTDADYTQLFDPCGIQWPKT